MVLGPFSVPAPGDSSPGGVSLPRTPEFDTPSRPKIPGNAAKLHGWHQDRKETPEREEIVFIGLTRAVQR